MCKHQASCRPDFFAVFIDDHKITNVDQPATSPFMVEKPDHFRIIYHFSLIAANDPFIDLFAAILDTGITTQQTEFDLQLEMEGDDASDSENETEEDTEEIDLSDLDLSMEDDKPETENEIINAFVAAYSAIYGMGKKRLSEALNCLSPPIISPVAGSLIVTPRESKPRSEPTPPIE